MGRVPRVIRLSEHSGEDTRWVGPHGDCAMASWEDHLSNNPTLAKTTSGERPTQPCTHCAIPNQCWRRSRSALSKGLAERARPRSGQFSRSPRGPGVQENPRENTREKDACRASTKDSAGWAGERSHLLLAEGAKFGDRGAPPIEGGRLRQRRKRFTNTASSAIGASEVVEWYSYTVIVSNLYGSAWALLLRADGHVERRCCGAWRASASRVVSMPHTSLGSHKTYRSSSNVLTWPSGSNSVCPNSTP